MGSRSFITVGVRKTAPGVTVEQQRICIGEAVGKVAVCLSPSNY